MVLYRPPKRAKIQEDHQSLEKFGTHGCPATYTGPFRNNIRCFLHEFAHTLPSQLPGVQRWCLPLRSEKYGVTITLFILEEAPFKSGVLHCNHCRVTGWNHHPVCRARYHFILPLSEHHEGLGVGKGRKICSNCGDVIASSVIRCPGCGLTVTKSNILETHTHLLHGVLHLNGYGHLIRVNGREGGSLYLSGCEIMDLWNHVCIMLRVRKVSVLDVSKKYGLSLRWLHGVCFGNTWYSRWDYKFGRGSFGIVEEEYVAALDELSSIPLTKLLHLFDDIRLKQIVACYKSFSEDQMSTLQDLLLFVMRYISKLKKCSYPKPDLTTVLNSAKVVVVAPSQTSQRWSTARLERAANVLFVSLKSLSDSDWVPRQKLRGRAREHIGDTGLLDHSLSSFVGKVFENRVVCRRYNEQLRMLEYRFEACEQTEKYENPQGDMFVHKKMLEDCERTPDEEGMVSAMGIKGKGIFDVIDDLRYIYDTITCKPQSEIERSSSGVLRNRLFYLSRIVLDTKQFMKDYCGNVLEEEQTILNVNPGQEAHRILCIIESPEKTQHSQRRWLQGPPSELVVLSKSATVGDLKLQAAKAFRDVYPSFSNFEVTSIPRLEGVDDKQILVLADKMFFTMRGRGVDEESPGRFERGSDVWTVDCVCGTKDDDGERMVACDNCGTWLHTRCSGISDLDPVPQSFVCKRCW